MFKSAILLSFLITQGYTLQSGLFLTNSHCSCPGHALSFECVINGTDRGTTVWKGAALQTVCTSLQDITVTLLHGDFLFEITGVTECSGGTIAWRTRGVDNSFYISRLNITYSTDLVGKAVICAYDNLEEEITIGSRNISINDNLTTYPPPSGIHLERANEEYLTFIWDPIAPECTAIRYSIISTDCGKCPDTTTHSSVTCSEFPVTTNGTLCAFAVQSEFCPGHAMYRTIGNMSDRINVTLKVPEPPSVDAIISRYSYLTGITTGFIVHFSKAAHQFTYYNGINGSTVSYTVTYINPASGVSCGSATVPVSSCVNGVCQHSFTYEESACNYSSVINISLSATNVLGRGPAMSYSAVVQENINIFVSVSLNVVSNHVLCTFHGQQTASTKSCSINYWLREDEACTSKSVIITQTSYSTLNDLTIGLPFSSLPSKKYCFNVMGDNGTYTAILEGTFDVHFNEKITTVTQDNQATNRILLGLSLTVVILISFIIVTVLILIILFLIRVCKKLQVQRETVQTAAVNSSTPGPVSIESTRAVFKPNSNQVYEELDGDGSDQAADVQNLAYPREDCVIPSSNSGETAC